MMITYIRLGISICRIYALNVNPIHFFSPFILILIVASECFFVNQLRRLYKKFIFP